MQFTSAKSDVMITRMCGKAPDWWPPGPGEILISPFVERLLGSMYHSLIIAKFPAGIAVYHQRHECPKSWFWLRQNFSAMFRCCSVKFTTGVVVASNSIFWSMISCSSTEIFVLKSQSCPKIWRFWAAKFFGGGTPNFWPKFKNHSHHGTCGKLAQRLLWLGGE